VTGDLHTTRKAGGAFPNGDRIRISPIGELGDGSFVCAGLNLIRRREQGDPGRCILRLLWLLGHLIELEGD